MVVKLFIFGLPGSGKSTAFRHIHDYVQDQCGSLSVTRFKDYTFLNSMFVNDTTGKKFSPIPPPPADHKGFDINDPDILDEALKQLMEAANQHVKGAHATDIVVIEFSRNDYYKALEQVVQFEPAFLQDAYFLVLNTEVKICQQRIKKRVLNQQSDDDHIVSKKAFKKYYNNGSMPGFSVAMSTFNIDSLKVRVVKNNGLFEEIREEINRFIDFIVLQISASNISRRPYP